MLQFMYINKKIKVLQLQLHTAAYNFAILYLK